ncbi:hypothetical protein C0J52_15447 [Blattella germanica]|nr:hypothetical protein C0J52_15447 [Blattella germanica]
MVFREGDKFSENVKIKFREHFPNVPFLLNELFGERIITKVLWPHRSPDLTPPDYFFWGAEKSTVYKKNPKSIDEVNGEITNYKVFQNKCKRLELCLQQQGQHFQHLL